ncbi:helix-hairpin-helix domain-containing protein [Halorussus aquaticus]|uniref:Helix-hairpin-helix domain-containing protein n=2 Tax=Halorussus aquaticus TaxID=2953748 RepID=A0ABD5PYB7_9EURY
MVSRFEDYFPLAVRQWLGEIDLDDPRTVEEIQLAYTDNRITEAEMERRLAVAVNPRTEQIRNAVEPVSGIGPETALNIAAKFESERELREASREDLEDVPNVGPERAAALRERL